MARSGVLLVFLVAIPIGHGVVPWALSLLSERHGWSGGGPGGWNLTGLVPVALGIGLLGWVAMVAFRSVPARVQLGLAPDYLVTAGPYGLTRNPMYVAELTLWIGWSVFFGSIVVGLGAVVLLVVIRWVMVPWEERSLRRRVGERYRMYEATTPRWLPRW
jgi:protein-S-isoprenylcysteine O-methyltransferase Ste14